MSIFYWLSQGVERQSSMTSERANSGIVSILENDSISETKITARGIKTTKEETAITECTPRVSCPWFQKSQSYLHTVIFTIRCFES